jgi:hypothetical protein
VPHIDKTGSFKARRVTADHLSVGRGVVVPNPTLKELQTSGVIQDGKRHLNERNHRLTVSD